MNDKVILSQSMPAGTWWDSRLMLGDNSAIYSRYRSAYRHRVARSSEDLSRASVWKDAEMLWKSETRKTLLCDPHKTRTYKGFLRSYSDVRPFEFEWSVEGLKISLELLTSYFHSFNNPATGLPFPIDLVDSNVTIPRGFIAEFVDEVEARLIRSPDVDKALIADHFTYLNPQKEES